MVTRVGSGRFWAGLAVLVLAGCATGRMRVQTLNSGDVSAKVFDRSFRVDRGRAHLVLVGRVAGHDSPEVHLAFSVACAAGPQRPEASRVVWWTPVARIYEEAVVRSAEVEVLSCDDQHLALHGQWELTPGPLTAQDPAVFPAVGPGPALRRLDLGRVEVGRGPAEFILDGPTGTRPDSASPSSARP